MNGYLILALILFGYMNIWFFVSVIFRRNDLADVAWGPGFVLLGWISFFIFGKGQATSVAVNTLVTVWGLQLMLHIFMRNKGKSDDFRYKEWRKQWGRSFFLRSYLQVYMLQGLFLYLIIQPVVFINSISGTVPGIFMLTGTIIWATGFLFEAVGDRQLARFISRRENKGEIMQEGLWRYSRHPNYFGEVLLWWGIFIIALGSENGILTVIGPLTISILIIFVSGVPLLEKKYAGRADFEEYKRKTSIFFPLPPKNS